MATYRQLALKKVKRLKKLRTNRTKALLNSPQKRGVVLRIGTESPKKPNSAKRRVAKIRLCTGKHLRVQVPGENPGSIQKFSRVLIRGAHCRDLPGIRFRVIRGKLDSNPVYTRRKARSKYGVKKRHLIEYQKLLESKALEKKKKK